MTNNPMPNGVVALTRAPLRLPLRVDIAEVMPLFLYGGVHAWTIPWREL